MKMLLRFLSLLYLGFILYLPQLQAQLPIISQFTQAPIQYNPAFTGNTDGLYRISLVHRAQSLDAKGGDYTTNLFSFDLNRAIKNEGNSFGVGFNLLSDRHNSKFYRNIQMALSGAYHQQVGKGVFLSGGLQLGYLNSATTIGALDFGSEFNSSTGLFTNNSPEFNEDSAGSFLLNVGVTLSKYLKENSRMRAGLALLNVLAPKKTAASNQNNQLKVFSSNAWAVNLDYDWYSPKSLKIGIHPNFLLLGQAGNLTVQTGLNASYLLQKEWRFYLGTGSRIGSALNLSTGVQHKSTRVLASIDIPYGKYTNSGIDQRASGFELSLLTMLNKKNKPVDPPGPSLPAPVQCNIPLKYF